jgi:uncharacterized membrane protein
MNFENLSMEEISEKLSYYSDLFNSADEEEEFERLFNIVNDLQKMYIRRAQGGK